MATDFVAVGDKWGYVGLANLTTLRPIENSMTDPTARLILLMGFACVLPMGLFFRLRSQTSEQLDRRKEGALVLFTLRPLAMVFVVGLFAFAADDDALQETPLTPVDALHHTGCRGRAHEVGEILTPSQRLSEFDPVPFLYEHGR